MEKPASNTYPINDLIRRRWSPRAFSDQSVDEGTLCSILEAARWAPSSYNDQPWRFIIGRESEESGTYRKVLDSLVEGNRSWASTAPVLGFSIARLNFTHNDEPNRHALHDVGLAVENLIIQAMDHGLFVHQMAGFDRQIAREHFEVPDDHEIVAGLAIGYPGAPDELPEDLQKRERSSRDRRPLEEMVYSGSWGTESAIVSEGKNT